MKKALKHHQVEFLKEESKDDEMQWMFYSSPVHSWLSHHCNLMCLPVVCLFIPEMSFCFQTHWLKLPYFLWVVRSYYLSKGDRKECWGIWIFYQNSFFKKKTACFLQQSEDRVPVNISYVTLLIKQLLHVITEVCSVIPKIVNKLTIIRPSML